MSFIPVSISEQPHFSNSACFGETSTLAESVVFAFVGPTWVCIAKGGIDRIFNSRSSSDSCSFLFLILSLGLSLRSSEYYVTISFSKNFTGLRYRLEII